MDVIRITTNHTRLRLSHILKTNCRITEQEINAESNLDVAAAHVVLVALQGKVPVFWVDEAN